MQKLIMSKNIKSDLQVDIWHFILQVDNPYLVTGYLSLIVIWS